MNENIRKKLEAEGWQVGSAQDFLDLRDDEVSFIDMKIRLKNAVKRYRSEAKITQEQLAAKIGSSQSRVAKIEAGDPSVSTDLMMRCLLAMNVSIDDIAAEISPGLIEQIQKFSEHTVQVNTAMDQVNVKLRSLEYSVYQIQARRSIKAAVVEARTVDMKGVFYPAANGEPAIDRCQWVTH